VFQPFWDYQNLKIPEAEWMERFEQHKKSAAKALGRMNTEKCWPSVSTGSMF
jgi:hypothetical protein